MARTGPARLPKTNKKFYHTQARTRRRCHTNFPFKRDRFRLSSIIVMGCILISTVFLGIDLIFFLRRRMDSDHPRSRLAMDHINLLRPSEWEQIQQISYELYSTDTDKEEFMDVHTKHSPKMATKHAKGKDRKLSKKVKPSELRHATILSRIGHAMRHNSEDEEGYHST